MPTQQTPPDLSRPAAALLALLLATLLFAATEVLLCSCTRTVYQPVESVRTETVLHEAVRTVADTVRDTRLVYIKGDTVLDRREVERTRLVELRDTLLVERTDTLRVPLPVASPLSAWERTRLSSWPWLAAALLLLFVWTFRKPLAKFLRKLLPKE